MMDKDISNIIYIDVSEKENKEKMLMQYRMKQKKPRPREIMNQQT